MRIVIFTTAILILILPHAAHSQNNGEAQTVIVEKDKRLTLKFSNKADKQRCGLFVSNRLINQEQAFAIRVSHFHYNSRQDWGIDVPQIGGPYILEYGWLYITPSRIVFTVEQGDKSHSFDVPRIELKSKPVSNFDKFSFTGLQINLKEKLAGSNSTEQKFVFLMYGTNCQKFVTDLDAYSKFLKRTIDNFASALDEFKHLTDSLTRSGNTQLASESVAESGNSSYLMAGPPNPYDGRHYAMLSVSDAENGRMEQAKANAEKAVELLQSPSEDSEFFARGVAHLRLENYDVAIADFDKAIQLNPQWGNLYLARGSAYSLKKDYDSAIANFDKAIQIEPDLEGAYFGRGRVYSSKGDWDRAIADYDKAIELDPQWAIVYVYRGQGYESKGDSTRALADYDKAIQLNGNAFAPRGVIYAKKGDYERALADFDKAIELDPKETSALTSIELVSMTKKVTTTARLSTWIKRLN